MIAIANGPYGYYRQGVGWRMLLQRPAVQAVRHRADHLGRRRGRRLRQPGRPATAEPTIQAFCVPIVYLDRDTLEAWSRTPTALTITTVVVKPKSRGFVRLRSADPDDMPLVSPNLLQAPRRHARR